MINIDKEAKKLLRKIAREITDKTWCQRNFALNRRNEPTQSYMDDAAKWCAQGFVNKYTLISMNPSKEQIHVKIRQRCQKLLHKALTGRNLRKDTIYKVSFFNDLPSTTSSKVKELFLKASK